MTTNVIPILTPSRPLFGIPQCTPWLMSMVLISHCSLFSTIFLRLTKGPFFVTKLKSDCLIVGFRLSKASLHIQGCRWTNVTSALRVRLCGWSWCDCIIVINVDILFILLDCNCGVATEDQRCWRHFYVFTEDRCRRENVHKLK